MSVSVILTIKNEAASLPRLLESLAAQTRPPDQIIVSDGGSTDGSLELLQSWREQLPLVVIPTPGANIAAGRNAAIAAACGDQIAVTDAGVYLSPHWLAALLAGLAQSPIVAGWFTPDPQSPFEMAMGATVLPALRDINPQAFLPSSRSLAFLKSAWAEVGGYPEWLDYCEDLIFDLRLRDRFGPFTFAPDAVAHFRPRGSLSAFWKQYYHYARGDGKADLWRKRHLIRYLTYGVAAPLLVASLLAGWHWGAILLALGGAIYTGQPYRRLLPSLATLSWPHRLLAIAAVPTIRLVGDLAKMAGYPIGLLWRWRNRHRPEIHWRGEGQRSGGGKG